MIRRYLAAVFVLFLIFVNAIPSTGFIIKDPYNQVSFGNTLYVGGSGSNNYTKIQYAIDNASHGDIVFVYSGFYTDFYPEYFASVFIDKKIKLLGEDKNTTIIDGGNNRHVVRIYADDIIISGFTIQNSGNHGAGIDSSVSNDSINFKIYRNIIKNNHDGFLQSGTDYGEVYDNIITDNYNGICITGWEVSIYGNIIENNIKGILVLGGNSVNILDNHFENNEVGVALSDSKITISENNFIDNGKHVDFGKTFWIWHFLLLFSINYRSTFRNNYWDDWKLSIPRPILGQWAYLSIILAMHGSSGMIGPFPSVQFDLSPVIIPYDIEVTQ